MNRRSVHHLSQQPAFKNAKCPASLAVASEKRNLLPQRAKCSNDWSPGNNSDNDISENAPPSQTSTLKTGYYDELPYNDNPQLEVLSLRNQLSKCHQELELHKFSLSKVKADLRSSEKKADKLVGCEIRNKATIEKLESEKQYIIREFDLKLQDANFDINLYKVNWQKSMQDEADLKCKIKSAKQEIHILQEGKHTFENVRRQLDYDNLSLKLDIDSLSFELLSEKQNFKCLSAKYNRALAEHAIITENKDIISDDNFLETGKAAQKETSGDFVTCTLDDFEQLKDKLRTSSHIKEMKSTILHMHEEIKSESQKHASELNILQAQTYSLESLLSEKKSSFTEKQRMLQKAESDIIDRDKKLSDTTSELIALQEKELNVKARNEANKNQAENRNLCLEISQLRKIISENAQKLQEHVEQNQKLQLEIQQCKSEVHSLLLKETMAVQKHEEQLDHLQYLQNTLQDQKQQNNSLEKERNSLQEKVQILEAETSRKNNVQNKTMQFEVQTIKLQADSLTRELKEEQQEHFNAMKLMNADVQDQKQVIKELKEKCAASTVEYQRNLKELHEENQCLKNDLSNNELVVRELKAKEKSSKLQSVQSIVEENKLLRQENDSLKSLEKIASDLEKRNHSLEDKCEKNDRLLNDFQELQKQWKKDKCSFKVKTQLLEAEIGQMKSSTGTNINKENQLKDDFSNRRRILFDKDKTIKDLETQIQGLQSEVQRYKAEAESLKRKMKRLQEQLNEMKYENEHLEQKLQGQINQTKGLNTENQGLQNKLSDKDKENQRLQNKLTEKDTENRRLRNELSDKDTENQWLQFKLRGKEAVIKELEATEAWKLQSAEAISKENQSLKEEIDSLNQRLQNELSGKDGEIEWLQNMLSGKDTENQLLQNKLRGQETAIQELTASERTSADRLQSAEYYQSLKQEIDSLKQQAWQQEDIEKQKKSAYQAKIDQYKKTTGELNRQLKEVQQESNNKDRQIEELPKRLAAKMSTKVSWDETVFENVSIKNRPMNIAAEYEMICSCVWLDAKNELDKMCPQMTEDGKVKLLMTVLEVSEKEALQRIQFLMSQFHTMISAPFTTSSSSSSEMPSSVDKDVNVFIGDKLRCYADNADMTSMCELVKKIIGRNFPYSTETNQNLNTFIDAAARVTWKMVLQRPPMYFSMEGIGEKWQGKYKQDLYWNSSDHWDPSSKVKYYVYPALYHGESLMVNWRVLLAKV